MQFNFIITALYSVTFIQEGNSKVLPISEENTWALVILSILTLAVIHMVFSFKMKRFKVITLDEIKNKRKLKGLPELASEQENELAMDYLEEMFSHWTIVSTPNEEELKAPTRKIHLTKSLDQFEKVNVLLPTDEYVIYRMNELGNVLNINAKRVFSGSKLLIIASLILCVFLYFNTKNEMNSIWSTILSLWWLWGSIIFYVFASFTPQFLVDKRLRRLQNTSYDSAVVAFFAGLFIGIPTFNFMSSRTRGSTSLSLIGIVISFVLLGILASFIIIFGLLNYIRNFIFYF